MLDSGRANYIGFGLMFLSAVCAAFSAVLTYYTVSNDPKVSILFASLLRVIMHPFTWGVGVLAACLKKQPLKTTVGKLERHHLKRRAKCSWLISWGTFGALTVVSYYLAIDKAGIALASVGASLSGVVTAFLAALYVKRLRDIRLWLSVIGTLAGILLINQTNGSAGLSTVGLFYSLLSGVAGGIAYFSISRVASEVSSFEVMGYWTVFCLPVHLVLMCNRSLVLPSLYETWGYFAVAGGLLSASQLLAAKSFAYGKTEQLSFVAYLCPVLVCALDWALFERKLGLAGWLGSFLILSTVFFTSPRSDVSELSG